MTRAASQSWGPCGCSSWEQKLEAVGYFLEAVLFIYKERTTERRRNPNSSLCSQYQEHSLQPDPKTAPGSFQRQTLCISAAPSSCLSGYLSPPAWGLPHPLGGRRGRAQLQLAGIELQCELCHTGSGSSSSPGLGPGGWAGLDHWDKGCLFAPCLYSAWHNAGRGHAWGA